MAKIQKTARDDYKDAWCKASFIIESKVSVLVSKRCSASPHFLLFQRIVAPVWFYFFDFFGGKEAGGLYQNWDVVVK